MATVTTNNKERKTIMVSKDTWERLRKQGAFGDNFDSIIAKLLNNIEQS